MMLSEDALDGWTELIAEYRRDRAGTNNLADDLPFVEFLEYAISDIRAYRAVLQRIADSAPSSPAGRAAWQEARRVLKGEKTDAETSDAAK